MAAYLPKRWPQRRRWRSFTSSDERSKKTAHLLGRHLEVASKRFPGHLRPATFLSFPMSSQLLPTYESCLVVSLYKSESRNRRIRDARSFGVPLEFFVPRVSLACACILPAPSRSPKLEVTDRKSVV